MGWMLARCRAGRLAYACLVLTAAMLLAPLPASAQERYQLEQGHWQPQPAPDPDSPEGKLQAIRKALAAEQASEAQDLAHQWIREYPNHPLLVEAYLLRGDAKTARRRYYEALFDYEQVIRFYPASEQFHTALEREYEIARLFIAGMNRHFLGLRILPAKDEGEELLIRIQERAPGSELGERASLTLADYYYDEGQMTSAAEAYDLFLVNYPPSQRREWAMLRLIQANLARFKGPEFDSTGLIEAAQRLKTYQDEFPAAADRIGADALRVRINESLARKDYLTARWYERRGERVGAAHLYRRLVQDYPLTAAAKTAIERLEALDVPLPGGIAPAGSGDEAAPAPATAPAAPLLEDPS